MKTVVVMAALALTFSASAAVSAEPLTLQNLRTLVRVSDARITPDGTKVAFIANDSKNTAHVFTIPMHGGMRTQLTHAKKDAEQYAWDPTGTRIA